MQPENLPEATPQPVELPEAVPYLVETERGETGIGLSAEGEILVTHGGRGLGVKLNAARLRGLAYAFLTEAERQERAEGPVDPQGPMWASRVQGNA